MLGDIKKLPPSERAEAAESSTKAVSAVLNGMKASGATSRRGRHSTPGGRCQIGCMRTTLAAID